MKGSTFRYVLPQALKSLRNNGWMTLASVLTIAISLFLCVIFWLLILNLDANATMVESEVEIIGYIDEAVPEEEYYRIAEALENLEGCAEVGYISKDEGLNRIAPRFGGEEELLASLGGENPLPNSYYIKALSPEYVAPLASMMEGIAGISSVRYGQDTVDNLFAFTGIVRSAGLGIMVLLAFAAIMLVAMTIRITVYARRKEIMVMKWVGATNWFIRWPFLLEGIILGLAGAIIAVILALVVYHNAGNYVGELVNFLIFMETGIIWQQVALYSLTAGILMGAVGSVISMAKFLNV